MGLCTIAADDLVHRVAHRDSHARGGAPDVALCGRQVLAYLPHALPVDDGDGCHVCLPSLAHPLAEVWDTCRRWDADANARACIEPPTFLSREGVAC
jgi:hypothetical protein